MKRLFPLAVVVALAVGCGSSHRCPRGAEIVLRAVPQRSQTINGTQMHTAQQIMAERVKGIGVSSPKVTLRGNDEIVIRYAGVHSPAKTGAIVGSPGKLQFFDFEKDLAAPTVSNGNPTPYPTLYSLLTAVKGDAAKGTPEAYYLFGTKTRTSHPLVKNAVLATAPTLKQLLAPYGGHEPPGTTVLAVPAHREVVSGSTASFTASTQAINRSPDSSYWYLFKLPSEISGTDLDATTVQAGNDPQTNVPRITIGFNDRGGKEFQAITKAEYNRGQLLAGLHGSAGQLNQAYAQHNAIVLDDRLQATPYIDYTDPSLSLGIAGAQAVISNMGSIEAAQRLALVLQSGALPYTFERVSSHAGCVR